jgi:P4 family phage/plasmid primase-like protien
MQLKRVQAVRDQVEEAKKFVFVPMPLNGKIPIVNGWNENKTSLDDCFEAHGWNCNIGVITGVRSGIIVLDIDVQNHGLEHWISLVKEHGEPMTPCVQTGSGGYHYYFKYEKGRTSHLKSRSKALGNNIGIDIKADGGQVVYPGSLYPGCGKTHKCGKIEEDEKCKFEGATYNWIKSPSDIQIAPMPDWLLDLIRTPKQPEIKLESVGSNNNNNNATPTNFLNTESSIKYNSSSSNKEEEEISDTTIHDLVTQLSVKRSDSYDSWTHVVWCLKKLSSGTERFKELARTFSKRSSKYNEKEFLKKWVEGRLDAKWNIGSLRKALKEDVSKDKYEEFCREHFPKNNDDINASFWRNIYRKDEGLAEIYVCYYEDCMRITTTKGDGYLWNEEAKLWKRADHKECKHSIKKVLEPVLHRFLDEAKVQQQQEKDDKISKPANKQRQDGSEAKKQQQEKDDKISKPANKQRQDGSEESEKWKVVSIALSKILSSHTLTAIFECVAVKLVDASFDLKINLADPDVLPIANGNLINLCTLQMRQRTKADLFSFECPVSYLGDSHVCPNAKRFFDQVFVGNADLIDFAQQLFGYAMTQHVSEKSLYFLWGRGNNGKTTLMEIMRDIMAGYYSTLPKEVLLKQDRPRGRDAASPSLMAIQGRRLCSVAETNPGEILDEAEVKRLTGADTISGRHLYQSTVEFSCLAKLMMLTNDPPSYNTLEQAMQDRIKLVPFLAHFTTLKIEPNEQRRFPIDQSFVEKLRTVNLSEVFTLLARGAQRWYSNGRRLVYPAICKDELNNHLEKQDHLSLFMAERCLLGLGDNFRIPAAKFYKEYSSWCISGGVPKPDRHQTRAQMKEKGYDIHRSNGEYYKGLSIISDNCLDDQKLNTKN